MTAANTSPDLEQMGRRVGELLTLGGYSIAVAESSTGGLIAASLLAVPGASSYFVAGNVVYTRRAWERTMNVSIADAGGSRPLNEHTALFMARTVRKRLDVDWGIGEIGAAGPEPTRYGDAPGHSCIAVVGPGVERCLTIDTGEPQRTHNMWAFTGAALDLLASALNKK